MRNPNLLKGLLEHITQEVIIYQKAKKMAADPEKSEKSKGLGITSIIFSILAIVGAVGLPFISYALIVTSLSTNLAIIGNIVLFCFAITILIIPVLIARYAIVFSRAQRIVNKKKIGTVSGFLGWISFILSLVILVVLCFYVAGSR